MSIRDEIASRCLADDLWEVVAPLPGRRSRMIYLHRALAAEVEAGMNAVEGSDERRVGRLIADFERFCAGERVSVGYGNEKHSLFKLLDPLQNEVWEIRSQAPSPAIRVFGGFALPDVFVGTHMAWRRDVGAWGDSRWAAQIRQSKVIWRQLFGTYRRHTGTSVNDYITENVVELRHHPR